MALTLVKPGLPVERKIGGVTYYLRVPRVYERLDWQQAVAEAGAKQTNEFDKYAVLKIGIEQAMAESEPEVRAAVIAKVDRHLELLRKKYVAAIEASTPPTEEQKKAFAEINIEAALSEIEIAPIEDDVAAGFPALAKIRANNAVYWQKVGIEGARLFLDGWSRSEELKRNKQGLTEESLSRIDPQHFAAIGQALNELTRPTETDSKNVDSQSSTPSEGTTSSAASNTTETKH